MHFICTLCGIFLHIHVSHIHCLIVLFYLCNFQYILIRIFVLLLFFFFVDYIIPISQCTYAYMHMHIHNHTELNSQSITELMNIKHRHHPYECSVFCVLYSVDAISWVFFLTTFRYACVYISIGLVAFLLNYVRISESDVFLSLVIHLLYTLY